jgi:hypothetical protein
MDAMHAKLLVFLAASLAACADRTALRARDSGTTGAGGDPGTPVAGGDASREGGREVPPFIVDGALASFCSGDVARMVLNGSASYPVVTGRRIPYSCCFGGQFQVTTETLAGPLLVTWQWSDTRSSSIPMSVDLSSSSNEWRIWVTAGCDPLGTSCTNAGDIYTSGLQGVLEVTFHASVAWDTNLCLHVQQPAGSSHPLIQSLALYAPHVQVSY